MNNKEQILKENTFLDKPTIEALFNALLEGNGRVPTEEELHTACDWATEVALEETYLSLVKKGFVGLQIVLDEDSKSGKKTIALSSTEFGSQAHDMQLRDDENLKDEGSDMLKDMLEKKDE